MIKGDLIPGFMEAQMDHQLHHQKIPEEAIDRAPIKRIMEIKAPEDITNPDLSRACYHPGLLILRAMPPAPKLVRTIQSLVCLQVAGGILVINRIITDNF